MSKPVIISETPMSMSQVKAELEVIKKRDDELGFRAQKTEEYLQQVEVLSKKDADELQKKLEGLSIPRLKPEHVLKIVDLLPKSADEVKTMFQGHTVTITAENAKKIADAVAEIA